jgi:dTDP-4-dehydrorhamnose 3,5-epimerase
VPEAGPVITIAERHGASLAILARAEKSLGVIIVSPDSNDLIHGVRIEPLKIFADDRGFFTELARLGTPGVAEDMVSTADSKIQISATLTYPGTIKAIHYHFEQTDLWAPVQGMFQVFLYDMRCNSPSFGRTNTLYVGQYRPWTVLIPPGVGHGYKVLGTQPAVLVYLTNRYYNPKDEGRLSYDHPAIGYDWETQHK